MSFAIRKASSGYGSLDSSSPRDQLCAWLIEVRNFSNSYAAEDLKSLEALRRSRFDMGFLTKETQDRIQQIYDRCVPVFQEGLHAEVVQVMKDLDLNFAGSPSLSFPDSPFQEEGRTLREEDYSTPARGDGRISPPTISTKRSRPYHVDLSSSMRLFFPDSP